MSVKYKLLKYHGHFSTRSEYRAVTIENQVVGIDRIGRSIQGATSLTHADVIAAIAALRDEISSQLMSGNVVQSCCEGGAASRSAFWTFSFAEARGSDG